MRTPLPAASSGRNWLLLLHYSPFSTQRSALPSPISSRLSLLIPAPWSLLVTTLSLPLSRARPPPPWPTRQRQQGFFSLRRAGYFFHPSKINWFFGEGGTCFLLAARCCDLLCVKRWRAPLSPKCVFIEGILIGMVNYFYTNYFKTNSNNIKICLIVSIR